MHWWLLGQSTCNDADETQSALACFSPQVAYLYTKVRSEFGKHCSFKDVPAFLLETVPCSTEYDDNYVARNPSIAELDTSPHMSGERTSRSAIPVRLYIAFAIDALNSIACSHDYARIILCVLAAAYNRKTCPVNNKSPLICHAPAHGLYWGSPTHSVTWSEHEANTERLITKHTSMRHVEGGWPKDVDFTEQVRERIGCCDE